MTSILSRIHPIKINFYRLIFHKLNFLEALLINFSVITFKLYEHFFMDEES